MDSNIKKIEEITVEVVNRNLDIPYDDFPLDVSVFDLGLDSIGAVEVVSQLEEKLNMSIDPSVLYEFPTIAEFIKFLADDC